MPANAKIHVDVLANFDDLSQSKKFAIIKLYQETMFPRVLTMYCITNEN